MNLNLIIITILSFSILFDNNNAQGPLPTGLSPCPGSTSGTPCCDTLQVGCATKSNDCSCSDQTGGVGTCNCTTSPNTRQGWLCIKDANGDSVNINILTSYFSKTHGKMATQSSYFCF